MKRSIFLVLGFCLFLAQISYGQANKKKPQPKVPAVVLQAFTAKYPDLKPKDWDWEPEKELYEADFMQDGKEREAVFSPTGKWMKTKTEISQAELPAAVSQAATTGDLGGWSMHDVNQIESPDKGTYYKIRFKKGKEEQSLKFDANGNLMENKASKHKSTTKT